MEINTFTKLDKFEFGCQLTHSISNLTQLHFSSDARAMVSWRDGAIIGHERLTVSETGRW
jgi:hypothetical protein